MTRHHRRKRKPRDGLPPDALVEFVLIGMTLDGMEFEARDCIRLPGGDPGV